jgi:2-polyprenyl-6-methoxyphenol hydroxylase-like FAD-dependent oxidoreductase
MGDALCRLNPVYAQGMTVAALQALALRAELRAAPRGGWPRVAARFSRAAGKLVSAAWAVSARADLRFPEVAGRRGPGDRLVDAYLTRLRAAASVDPALGAAFLRVVNMIDPPARLLSPRNAVRVGLSLSRGSRSAARRPRRSGRGWR